MNTTQKKKPLLFAAVVLVAVVFVQCGGPTYESEGEAIFHSGKSLDGAPIGNSVDRSALPDTSMVLSCAGCHGADAKGAKNKIPAFRPYRAPDIRWETLTSPDDGTPYTVESFSATLHTGIAPEGYRLHHPMPSWELTLNQTLSLVEYLQTK